jgi:hypothetical protein
MTADGLAYYVHRIIIERDLAANSANPAVAEIHEKLASLYETLVRMGDRQPLLRIVA